MRRFILLLSILLSISSSLFSAQDTLRVLTIGNSFSVDGVTYLDELAAVGGVPLIIANAEIGGCSIERHVMEATTSTSAYAYIKALGDDEQESVKTNLATVLADEPWDIISIQQVSSLSGLEDSYEPFITQLMTFIEDHVVNPDFKFAFQQTWAYPTFSTSANCANYENSQSKMYVAILNAVKRVTDRKGISIVVPSGTAIQNGRSVFTEEQLHRDGIHLSYKLGRYLAACTWYEKLLGESVMGNPYYPAGVSAEDAYYAQKSAVQAVSTPWVATLVEKDYVVPDSKNVYVSENGDQNQPEKSINK